MWIRLPLLLSFFVLNQFIAFSLVVKFFILTTGNRFQLYEDSNMIGSSSDGASTDIVVDHEQVSSVHAEIEINEDGAAFLKDLR